jgi:hypothetical protein
MFSGQACRLEHTKSGTRFSLVESFKKMTIFVETFATRNTTLPKPTFNYKTGKWLKYFSPALSCRRRNLWNIFKGIKVNKFLLK